NRAAVANAATTTANDGRGRGECGTPAWHRDQTSRTFHRARWPTAGRRRVVEDRRPGRAREIGVDREDTIVAAAEEGEALEAPIADQTVEQYWRCQRIELTAGILDLHRPEEGELALLDGVLREARVAAQPAAALRIEAARRPLATASALRVPFDFAQGRQQQRSDQPQETRTNGSLNAMPAHGLLRCLWVDAEAIQCAVVGPEIDPAVGDRQAAEVTERRD